jgi:protein SCO1/2
MTLLRGVLVLALAWLTAALIQTARNGRPAEDVLPVQGEVGGFTLIGRDGAAMSAEELKGRVWIADFIFTRCASTCPAMTREMARLASDFARHPDLRYVSFTVDPEHDSPQVLDRYAANHGAGESWFFLTGPRDRIYDLARTRFHLGVEDVEELAAAQDTPGSASGADGAAEPFIHSTRFVLVDRQGRIRGYYDSADPLKLRRLRTDVQSLLREPVEGAPPGPPA